MISLCHGKNLRHPVFDLQFLFRSAFSLFFLPVVRLDLHLQPTALLKDLFQDPNQLPLLLPGQDRLFQYDLYGLFIRIRNLRILKQTVLQRRQFPQFLHNAFFVDFHQLLRGVQGGEMESLIYFYDRHSVGKQLIFYLSLQRPDLFLFYQMFAAQIYAQNTPVLRCGDPLHLRSPEHCLHIALQLQARKYLFKWFHCFTLPTKTAPAAMSQEVASPAPF